MKDRYACYEFYQTEYGDNLTEAEFERNIKKATAYIRRLTLRKSDDFTGEELKYATCAVVEAYAELERNTVNGRVVASENNDGFSVSFENTGKSIEKIRNDAAYHAAKTWLSGTGLLSRRCARVNKC